MRFSIIRAKEVGISARKDFELRTTLLVVSSFILFKVVAFIVQGKLEIPNNTWNRYDWSSKIRSRLKMTRQHARPVVV